MLQGRPDENDSKQGKEIVPLDFSSTGLVLRCNNNQFQLGVINIIGLHAKTPFFFFF